MLLRARTLLPVTAPSVEDGAVLVSGGRIAALGRWGDLRVHVAGPVVDLGPSILMPGFINAHCHLDYTHLAGHLPPPKHFTDWIQGVLALKAAWSFSEYADSWMAGARQLLATGCTTVLDIEAVPELLPDAWFATPLRVISALEMTGVRSGRPAGEILGEALGRLAVLEHPWNRGGLAPHAPYSTRRDLLEKVAETGRSEGLVTTLHLAESQEEFDMFRHARGPMYDWLRGQRDVSDCGQGSPVRHAVSAGMGGERCLFAHVNYLDDGDATLLANSGASVVHCPRSHDYFRHEPFPWSELREAGVNLCLGTDSLLSVRRSGRQLPRLDCFAELSEASRAFRDLPAEVWVEAATAAGARALGRAGELGELRVGAMADLIAVPHSGTARSAAEAVVHNQQPLVASMIGGVWVQAPPLGGGESGVAG